MPYRRLPEAGRARVQFDQTLDRRIRALERRSRSPGAMRVVEADTVSTTTGTSGAYLSLRLDRGSWMILGGLNLVYYPLNRATEGATVTIKVYDDESGSPLPAIGPPGRWTMQGVASTLVIQSFTLFGHGHFDAPVRLDLHVVVDASGVAHGVAIENLCLQASPA